MEVVKGRGYVYSIQYHIVWCVKYRRDVLNGQVAIKLKELLTQISKDNDFQILEMYMEHPILKEAVWVHVQICLKCLNLITILNIEKEFLNLNVQIY